MSDYYDILQEIQDKIAELTPIYEDLVKKSTHDTLTDAEWDDLEHIANALDDLHDEFSRVTNKIVYGEDPDYEQH